MPISVECDDPNKSSAIFYWLVMKYRWTHAVCLTDFSQSQLLCLKTLVMFPLSGDFWWQAKQPRNRSRFPYVHFWTFKCMGHKFCRFCSLITQITFFVIPKVCLSKCVFHCLNTWLRRFTLECGFIFLNTSWYSSLEWKSFKRKFKGSLKYSFSVKAK